MKNKLEKLLANAHSPYSKVKVSSIVKGKDGTEYVGVNVENAAYPSSICAERSAITNAISNGEQAGSLSEIHIHSNLEDTLYPCGACLQVMAETLADDAKVVLHGKDEIIETSLKELMPKAVKKEAFKWK